MKLISRTLLLLFVAMSCIVSINAQTPVIAPDSEQGPSGGAEFHLTISCDGYRNIEYNQNLDLTPNTSVAFGPVPGAVASHLRRFQVIDDNRVIEHITYNAQQTPAGLSIEAKVYSIAPGDALAYANMTEQGTGTYTFDGSELGSYISIPVVGRVPVGDDFVIELTHANDDPVNRFQVGYNNINNIPVTNPNQTAPSYISFNKGAINDLAIFGGNFPNLAVIMYACGSDGIVPTLSEWGLIVLGLSLMIFAVVAIRQRQGAFTLSN